MNLTIIISMTILSETAAEYPDLSHHTIPWLSQGIVLWKFFELREQNLSEEPPSATIIEHWMALKIHFCCRFANISQWIQSKIRRPIAFPCKTYTETVISRTTDTESQVMSSCFTHFACCKNLRWDARSPMPHKYVIDIFSKIKLQFQHFSDLDTSSTFQKLFNCKTWSFYLTLSWKWLVGNTMIC